MKSTSAMALSAGLILLAGCGDTKPQTFEELSPESQSLLTERANELFQQACSDLEKATGAKPFVRDDTCSLYTNDSRTLSHQALRLSYKYQPESQKVLVDGVSVFIAPTVDFKSVANGRVKNVTGNSQDYAGITIKRASFECLRPVTTANSFASLPQRICK